MKNTKNKILFIIIIIIRILKSATTGNPTIPSQLPLIFVAFNEIQFMTSNYNIDLLRYEQTSSTWCYLRISHFYSSFILLTRVHKISYSLPLWTISDYSTGSVKSFRIQIGWIIIIIFRIPSQSYYIPSMAHFPLMSYNAAQMMDIERKVESIHTKVTKHFQISINRKRGMAHLGNSYQPIVHSSWFHETNYSFSLINFSLLLQDSLCVRQKNYYYPFKRDCWLLTTGSWFVIFAEEHILPIAHIP